MRKWWLGIGSPQNFEMSKGDYVSNILTISKLLVSSRLKIAWITDIKIKASSAYATFGKTGMLFFSRPWKSLKLMMLSL